MSLPPADVSCLAIHRRKLVIEHDPLEPSAYALLSRLFAGERLGEACESTAVEADLAPDAIAAHLERWFATWASLGYVIDIAS